MIAVVSQSGVCTSRSLSNLTPLELRLPVLGRKWPRSLFLPVQARSCKERSGAGWDQDGRDGPHLGTWMGPKHCKTKHKANLDGTTSDPGWDLDGPRIGPRRGSGWHPPETVTDF